MIDINLVPEHFRKKPKSKIFSLDIFDFPKETIIGFIGGLFVLLFAVHSFLQIIIFIKFVQHAREKKQWEHILPEKSKADVVINELRSLQSKISSIEKIKSDKRIFWAQKLNDLSDSISKGVWFNKVSFNETVLLIDGSAVSKTKDEMISVGDFVANLKNKKSFMNGLQNIELGSIQRRQLKSVDVVDFILTSKLK